MKIIITSPLFEPDIAEPASYVGHLISNLKDKYNLTVLTYSNYLPKMDDCEIICVKKNQPTPIRLIKYFFKLLQASKNADIIYAQNGSSSSLSSALVAALRKKPLIFRFIEDEAWERAKRLMLTDKPLEEFLRMNLRNFKIKSIKKLQAFVLKKSRIIIAPSNAYKNLISKYYKINDKKIEVVYNPYPKTIKLPFEARRKPNQILASGEHLTKKDLKNIFNAIRELKIKASNLKITGNINEEEFVQFDFVEFLGAPTRDEKFYLLKTSALHLTNTSTDKKPDALFDSILTCTPVINANKKNQEELRKKIKTILLHESKNNKDGQTNKDILIEKYSWDFHINKLERIFNEQK